MIRFLLSFSLFLRASSLQGAAPTPKDTIRKFASIEELEAYEKERKATELLAAEAAQKKAAPRVVPEFIPSLGIAARSRFAAAPIAGFWYLAPPAVIYVPPRDWVSSKAYRKHGKLRQEPWTSQSRIHVRIMAALDPLLPGCMSHFTPAYKATMREKLDDVYDIQWKHRLLSLFEPTGSLSSFTDENKIQIVNALYFASTELNWRNDKIMNLLDAVENHRTETRQVEYLCQQIRTFIEQLPTTWVGSESEPLFSSPISSMEDLD